MSEEFWDEKKAEKIKKLFFSYDNGVETDRTTKLNELTDRVDNGELVVISSVNLNGTSTLLNAVRAYVTEKYSKPTVNVRNARDLKDTSLTDLVDIDQKESSTTKPFVTIDELGVLATTKDGAEYDTSNIIRIVQEAKTMGGAMLRIHSSMGESVENDLRKAGATVVYCGRMPDSELKATIKKSLKETEYIVPDEIMQDVCDYAPSIKGALSLTGRMLCSALYNGRTILTKEDFQEAKEPVLEDNLYACYPQMTTKLGWDIVETIRDGNELTQEQQKYVPRLVGLGVLREKNGSYEPQGWYVDKLEEKKYFIDKCMER